MRWPAVLLLSLLPALTPSTLWANECVVLLHGLGRSDASMLVMAEVLTNSGYQVINEGYPSSEQPVEKSVEQVGESAAACGSVEKINFVTHSLGGILVRAWLRDHRPENLGRVVMLGPPNNGSEVVDELRNLSIYQYITGPAGQELGTGDASIPKALGPADFEVGIIAGDRTIDPLMSSVFDGPNDGKVSVESTKLDGMRDHIVLPTTHTFMMNNPLVIAQTLSFLRDGRFDPSLTMGDVVKRAIGLEPAEKPQ
ncbi:MAG: alpha/beta hydrolase [Mesorhizobium sp.]